MKWHIRRDEEISQLIKDAQADAWYDGYQAAVEDALIRRFPPRRNPYRETSYQVDHAADPNS